MQVLERMWEMVTTEWIRSLISEGELWKFYKTREWRQLKARILREHHYECQECRKLGILTRYDCDKDTGQKTLISTVHHVRHVRDYPELALSEFYWESGVRQPNLIPVCKACHNKLHPEKNKKHGANAGFTTVERW